MNVAKWLLSMLLALPFTELAAFIAVSAFIGFGWALVLILAGSSGGLLILRHAGGNHIERVRVALGHGDFTALQVDSSAGLVLLAGILLLIPGFITDFLAVLLLCRRCAVSPPTHSKLRATRHDRDAVIDLAPEQWHKVPDPSLPKRRREKDPC